jgi:hypothetical protein
MREDFISYFVRGCWLVSFFFTPIYMFFLIFLVMFNIKKGSITVYKGNWDFKNHCNNASVQSTSTSNARHLADTWYNTFKHKYQFTALTSRLTSYMLVSFWIFFFFFGESLLLILFNYSTPIDTIESSNFLVIKQHVIFFIQSSSTKLLKYINFFIFFLTLNAFFYMVNLSHTYNYNYMLYSTLNSVLIIILLYAFVSL